MKELNLIQLNFQPIVHKATNENLHLPPDMLREKFLDYPVSSTPSTIDEPKNIP